MSKVLVAYFSASGVTKKMAEKLSDAVGADIFEIKPETPYDKNCRPAIAEKLDNMKQYDVVFVGFPVWWYREPSIIDTFMEEYDFAGKTVVPFATSGMSPVGDSGKNMQALAPDARVVAGKRFPNSVSVNELEKWASEWI